MDKKYELLPEVCDMVVGDKIKQVYRIRALKDFKVKVDGTIQHIKPGYLGGYVSSEANLSHEGSCWIMDKAVVADDAIVKDDAVVMERACVDGTAIISDQAHVADFAYVTGNSNVNQQGKVYGHSKVIGSIVSGDGQIQDYVYATGSVISGNATVGGHINLNNSVVFGDILVYMSLNNRVDIDGARICKDEDYVLMTNVAGLPFIIFCHSFDDSQYNCSVNDFNIVLPGRKPVVLSELAKYIDSLDPSDTVRKYAPELFSITTAIWVSFNRTKEDQESKE